MATLKPGDKAPDFTLTDQHGKECSLSDFRGERLVVYFYPKANTPGCTTQACALRDAKPELDTQNAAVVGISPDAPDAQDRFDQKYDLGFPLLADEDHAVADAYGVWGEKKMYGKAYMGIIRSAFLVDAEGIIDEVWYKISPKETVPSVMAALTNA